MEYAMGIQHPGHPAWRSMHEVFSLHERPLTETDMASFQDYLSGAADRARARAASYSAAMRYDDGVPALG